MADEPPPFSDADANWMRLALELAARGQGRVEPNPMVGCVLVHNGQVIGQGFHTAFGQAHAEREAIRDCINQGQQGKLADATAYVTLEPCCHTGKTPPCTDALLEAGIAEIVVAMTDPFPKVQGGGIRVLREAGKRVRTGLLSEQAQQLNAPYLTRLQLERPWIIGKWAMSLDGRIATATGNSKWITGPEARGDAHVTRGRVDAVMVGINTALADDPMLNARIEAPLPRVASRIVIDSQLRLPIESKLVASAEKIPVIVLCGPEASRAKCEKLESANVRVFRGEEPDATERLRSFLKQLALEFQMTNVLVEGGSRLLGTLLELDAIDQCDVYVAPKLIGGNGALSPIGGLGFDAVDAGPKFEVQAIQPIGGDVKILCERAAKLDRST